MIHKPYRDKKVVGDNAFSVPLHILFLSAKTLKEDRNSGLKLVPMIINKPFSIEELQLKVKFS
jgi:DNA-binding response OmpR family regulator